MILTKNELSKQLKRSICEVTFTKLNGETRVMNCTLKPELLPVYEKKTTITKVVNDEVLSVYDCDAGAFKSFRVANVINIKTKEN
jgi:hypothetical protein